MAKGYGINEIFWDSAEHSRLLLLKLIVYFLREFNISNCARASDGNMDFLSKLLVHLLINLYIDAYKRILLRIETRFPVNLFIINIKCNSNTF